MKYKILHIASFAGNIGDIINHEGFYDMLGHKLDFEVDKVEIRKFYRNSMECKFDYGFAQKVNKYNALVIGGGGFFDVKWNESATGTTLDMSNDFLDAVKIPVVFNALGVHFDRKTNCELAIANFRQFLDTIMAKENVLISIRNDRSLNRLSEIYPNIDENIMVVPDAGFFFPTSRNKKAGENKGFKRIGLNITNDLFDYNYTNGVTEEIFNQEIIKLIGELIKKNYRIKLFAHTPQDIETIYMLYERLGATNFRYYVEIAPYKPFNISDAYDYSEQYKECDLVISMRFHGNIISMDNRIPIIALSGHEQISSLFQELKLEKYCVKVGSCNYINNILQQIDARIADQYYKEVLNIRFKDLQHTYDAYMQKVAKLIKSGND